MFSAFILAAMLDAPQQLPTIVVAAPKAKVTLQVARTPDQREIGLMHVTKLPSHTGMVFVFDQDAPVEFWMKNTLVPLDMVFVAQDGTVRDVFENVPSTQPTTPDEKIPRRDGKAEFVIELPAFEAARDGITTGTYLPVVPALGPSPAPPPT